MSKLVLILSAITLLALTIPLLTTSGDKEEHLQRKLTRQWNQFKSKYQKEYNGNESESYRFSVFAANVAYIKNENRMGHSHVLAINEFADLTPEEFKSIYLGTIAELKTIDNEIHQESGETLGDVDWRTKGAVQVVKNQGQCGSCWAFSAVGSMESESKVHGKGLGNYSEQQLVDCSRSYGNMGCNGGLMDYAFKFVKDHGIQNESSYPYTARDGACKQQGGDFKVSKYTDVQHGSTSALQSACNKQPVSVAVDAMKWQFYSGGIFSNCGTSLDHGVLLVGYTNDYWIIKNSWGTGWGEKGYIRLKAGNTCGLANMASYPSI